ncbi:MAG: SCP2 sterol-binding domain-containing protein [Halieaceae bacterium]|jgi:ubiquinone biosynthesis protein UbiJ
MSRGHDPAVITAVLAAVETTINKGLSLAPVAKRDLGDLAGTVIGIECTSPEVAITAIVEPSGQLGLSHYSERTMDTKVRGSLEDFVGLATAEDPAAALINGGLELVGNTAPLIAVQQIITTMDLDWEAPLVDTLGDVMGHQIAVVLRGLFRWGKASAESFKRQLSEFILEEGRLTPPAAELDDFYEQIEQLGLRVDRLQSRVQKLARRIGEQKP